MMSSGRLPYPEERNRPLAVGEEPPPGAHLITPRRGYVHHGIYVGRGRVIHYSTEACMLIRRPVEEVSLEAFSKARGVWIKARAPGAHDSAEVIRRARSRIGENRYRLFTNNCEHFCEWCVRGQHRSAQVDAILAAPRRLSKAAARSLHALIWITDRLDRTPALRLELVSLRRRGGSASIG